MDSSGRRFSGSSGPVRVIAKAGNFSNNTNDFEKKTQISATLAEARAIVAAQAMGINILPNKGNSSGSSGSSSSSNITASLADPSRPITPSLARRGSNSYASTSNYNSSNPSPRSSPLSHRGYTSPSVSSRPTSAVPNLTLSNIWPISNQDDDWSAAANILHSCKLFFAVNANSVLSVCV
jgi:hypothetical protein